MARFGFFPFSPTDMMDANTTHSPTKEVTDADSLMPPPSKTRRKQAMRDLQALGEALATLPAERIARIDLPENLRDAISIVKNMTRHDEARRRQMQYIGRLMRGIDPEPLRAALAETRSESAQAVAKLHRLEKWREDLLADEKLLYEIARNYPAANLQQLRALRRAALKEQAQNKPPRNYRALFQALKALTETQATSDESLHEIRFASSSRHQPHQENVANR